jgi:hypothetical protein
LWKKGKNADTARERRKNKGVENSPGFPQVKLDPLNCPQKEIHSGKGCVEMWKKEVGCLKRKFVIAIRFGR